ncbi:MAG: peptidoglycan DD-metalloendopeptidase family protein [bacterium]
MYKSLTLRIISIVAVALACFILRAEAAGNGHVVAIDAGHGTIVNKRDYEGERELAIAQKLKARLEADGYRVIMTRTSNKQILGGLTGGAERDDLRERAKIINAGGAEMTVSIHSDDYATDTYHVIYPDVTVKDKYGKGVSHPGNYLANARQMATKVSDAMHSNGFRMQRAPHGEAYNNTNDVAGRGKPLMISAHTKNPIITVEVYGHNSSALRQKYAQSAAQDKVAVALQKGVNAYFGTSPKTQNPVAAAEKAQLAQNQNLPITPKKDRNPNCPPEASAAGPGAGEDYRAQIAQAFMAEFSRRTEAWDEYNNESTLYEGQEILTGSGDCALPIPGNKHIISGLTGKRGKARHRGLDFSAPTGTPVVSVLDGVVVLTENQGFKDGTGRWKSTAQNGGYGNLMRIRHQYNGQTVYSEYHHLRTGHFMVKQGDTVTRGQVIGQADHNGWSSGSHLHFQMMTQNSSSSGILNPTKCLGL